ncbi:hypothetical protein [Thioalbus denitrificans]|nr:hypothetical protein [Thioalbus denitrificans]
MFLRDYIAAHAPAEPLWDFDITGHLSPPPEEPPRDPRELCGDLTTELVALAANWVKDPCYDMDEPSLKPYENAWNAFWAVRREYTQQARIVKRAIWPWIWADAVLAVRDIGAKEAAHG